MPMSIMTSTWKSMRGRYFTSTCLCYTIIVEITWGACCAVHTETSWPYLKITWDWVSSQYTAKSAVTGEHNSLSEKPVRYPTRLLNSSFITLYSCSFSKHFWNYILQCLNAPILLDYHNSFDFLEFAQWSTLHVAQIMCLGLCN